VCVRSEAFERAGNHGIVAVEFGNTVETTLEIVEGMAFDRGYLSHHMVTDVEKMQVVFDNPFIIMTDLKIQAGSGKKQCSSVQAPPGGFHIVQGARTNDQFRITSHEFKDHRNGARDGHGELNDGYPTGEDGLRGEQGVLSRGYAESRDDADILDTGFNLVPIH